MAQINDLLVLGESNLLGTLNVFGDVTAPNFHGKADSAINDTNGDQIDTTYLKRSGGTMTGNIFMKGANPYIAFQNADGVTQGYVQYVASSNTYGIGAGIANSLIISNTGSISIPANQTFTPGTTNTGSVGTSGAKWNAMYATTFYGALSGNATTSSYPLGFTSRNDNAQWGSQTGTTVTCWNEVNGGSVDWRRDNPSSGKISMKVDGRVYVNEGLNPVMAMAHDGNYWCMCDPDGVEDTYIRASKLGLIPYQSGSIGGGHQTIGTDTWRFASAYVDTIYNHVLQLGNSTQSSMTASGIYIHDLRDMTITANTFGDKHFNLYFDEITLEDNSNASWKGIMHVKGWAGSYVAWQLAGTATSSVKNKLYYREGLDSTWQKWLSVAFENASNTFSKSNTFNATNTFNALVTMTAGLAMTNTGISGIDNLHFADPGPKEGITWDGGSNWWIYESPDDLTTNSAGNLQFVHNATRRLTINTGGYVDINGRLVVRGNGSSYNEGIRILPASNGWSNIWFGSNTTDLSGNQAGGWLLGRRGQAGTIGAVGDFTIEHNNSSGVGLTLHQAGNATLYGTWFKIANKIALTYVADTESLDFVFS